MRKLLAAIVFVVAAAVPAAASASVGVNISPSWGGYGRRPQHPAHGAKIAELRPDTM
jgi:hypothetical protein